MEPLLNNIPIDWVQITDPSTGNTYFAPTSYIYPPKSTGEFTTINDVLISQAYRVTPLTQSVFITGSLDLDGPFIQIGDSFITGSTNITGSFETIGPVSLYGDVYIRGNETISGALKFDPVQDPDPTGADLDSTFLFQSASNTPLGYDLYVRQDGNVVKWKWIEANLNSGLLYGGLITWSGSQFTVSSGSGIIVNHNASYSEEVSPIIEYVNWADTTQTVTNIATTQYTWLYINTGGDVIQQSTPITSQEYHDYIPLGVLGHIDYANIVTAAYLVFPAYDNFTTIHTFIQAFGPLKLRGLDITPQTSLQLGYSGGEGFSYGGYYATSADFPSNKTFASQATASLTRCYISGSTLVSSPFTSSINPNLYNNNGTLTPVPSNDYTIQRLYLGPAGRIFVYYGPAHYANLATALTNLSTETFTESALTTQIAVFLGYIVVKEGTTDLTNLTNVKILQAGLARGFGGGGGGGGGGTPPGGLTTQIQYNNAGSFGGVPVLTYNGSTLSATGSFTGSFEGYINGGTF